MGLTHIPSQERRWLQLRYYSACGRLASLLRLPSLTLETRDQWGSWSLVVPRPSTRTRWCLTLSLPSNHLSRPPSLKLWLPSGPTPSPTPSPAPCSPLVPAAWPPLAEPRLLCRSQLATTTSTRWPSLRNRKDLSPSENSPLLPPQLQDLPGPPPAPP